MNTYIRLVIILALIFVGYGLVAPRLVSAPSGFMVTLGILVIIAVPVLAVGIVREWARTGEGKSVIAKIKTHMNEGNEDA